MLFRSYLPLPRRPLRSGGHGADDSGAGPAGRGSAFSGGDTVYASVSGGVITEMLFVKSGANHTHEAKTSKFKNQGLAKSPQQQENNKKILIDVPKNENISFD